MKKNICIIGAGNIGIACAVELSLNTDYSVFLLTKKAKLLPNHFKMINTDSTLEMESNYISVTDDNKVALKNADVVIVTLPSFLIESIINDILPFNPKIVYYFPGYGSKELFSFPLLKKGIIIAGLERVPYIARLHDVATVYVSKKKELSCASLKKEKTEYACSLIEEFFNIPCKRISNYLTISFTPSNPILHTARLYSMFKNYNFDSLIKKQIKFYADWTDYSSEILIGMDKELKNICDTFYELDLSQFRTIREHYESPDIKSMTNKISNIPAFQNIYSPLVEFENGYKIDSTSRYFLEDFPFGLCNLKGYADLIKINTPFMNQVIKWYEKIIHINFLDINNSILINDKTGIPQRFNMKNKSDIINFYK